MDKKYKQVNAQSLECPICLNIFKEPKILSCSHTYCKGCLEYLLLSQTSDDQTLPCPVCRDVTSVNGGGVGQLRTSTALKSLVEDVENQQQACTRCESGESKEAVVFCQACGKYLCDTCKKAHAQWFSATDHPLVCVKDISSGKISPRRRSKCKKHPKEDEECFCADCRKYVCFRCGMLEHGREGHRILEATEHEDVMKKKIEDLGSKANVKTEFIKKYIDSVDEQRGRLKDVLQQINNQIDKAYEESIQKLAKRKDFLKEKAEERIYEVKAELLDMKNAGHKQISRIKTAHDLVGNGAKVPVEEESLAVHDTLCQSLEGILNAEGPDYEKLWTSTKKGESITFERNVGKDELELGDIQEVGWSVVGEKELSSTNSMNAMAAMPNGRLAIGCCQGGIEIVSREGKLQESILKGVLIREVGVLSTGKYVVLDIKNHLSVYNTKCEKGEARFLTLSYAEGGISSLAVDADDQIYVSYRKAKKIQVFAHTGGKPVREIACPGYEPNQIFALLNPTGRLVIKCGMKSIRVVDASGTQRAFVTRNGTTSSAYPCVCRDGSVLIAWINHKEKSVDIDRYTDGLQFVQSLVVGHKIEQPKSRQWYYLQEFSSGEIAFCTPERLYVFQKLLMANGKES